MVSGSGSIPIAPTHSVVIIGRQSLQNRLLADLIGVRVGCLCLVRTLDGLLNALPHSAHVLMMLDVEDATADEISTHLRSLSAGASCRSIAVINADESAVFEQIVAWPKVKGVFRRDTSQEHLIKGLQAIFKDECWLPRKMLSAYLEQTRLRQRPRVSEPSHLTRKEIETLRLLAGGNSNSHIAHKLNVSPHTVKTHIYNLFRKIHVNNRVQAVNWALHNIDGVEQELG